MTLTLGSWLKQKHWKVQAKIQLGSVRKCEGMNSHTPIWTPILGIKIPMESQIFKEGFKGLNLIILKSFYTIEKIL
jgi:hypothetical protein